jgi:DNA-binding transcriptional regulator YiaG
MPEAKNEMKRKSEKLLSDLQREKDAARNMEKGLSRYDRAVEAEPHLKQTQYANRCGVSVRTLRDWLKTRKSGNR